MARHVMPGKVAGCQRMGTHELHIGLWLRQCSFPVQGLVIQGLVTQAVVVHQISKLWCE